MPNNQPPAAIELVIIYYFLLENENKHCFFEILSPQSILLVLRFPCIKSRNFGWIDTDV